MRSHAEGHDDQRQPITNSQRQQIIFVTVNGQTVEVADASRTVTAKFLLQPGAQFPWHTHPGPVFVNVKRGSLTFVSDECEKTNYPKGTAFVDLGHGHVHTAFNPSDTKETVLVATFFEAPAEPGPLLIPATAPAGRRCWGGTSGRRCRRIT